MRALGRRMASAVNQWVVRSVDSWELPVSLALRLLTKTPEL